MYNEYFLFCFVFKYYVPFLWMRFNLLKATEPLGGGSLLFTSKFQIFMVLT